MENNLLKSLDAWTEVFISDPLTNPIAIRLSKIKHIHPLQISAISQFLKLLGAALYFFSPNLNIILPPILFFCGILVDSMDGKVARLTGKSIRVHGTFDFMSDQISNSIFFLSMLMAFRHNDEYFFWMLIWFIILFINMSLTSTRYRLLSSLGGVDTDNPEELRSKYEVALSPFLQRPFLKKIFVTYITHMEKTRKYRVYPHPTVVDSEFVFFVIFPIFVAIGNQLSSALLLFSVVLLIPDIIYYGALCVALTKHWESKKD